MNRSVEFKVIRGWCSCSFYLYGLDDKAVTSVNITHTHCVVEIVTS